MDEFIFLEELVEMIDIDVEEITSKCINGEIDGAVKVGLQKKWAIPILWVRNHVIDDLSFDYNKILSNMKEVNKLIEDKRGIIDQVLGYVAELASSNNDGHSFTHLINVLKISLLLQMFEGGDTTVLIIASILHDLHRYIVDEIGQPISPKDSLKFVNVFTKRIGISQSQQDLVNEAIAHHEDYHFDGSEEFRNHSVEAQIVQDADNIDAMGAIGIFRCIRFGCKHGVPDYDSKVPLYQINPYFDGYEEASSIHHMHNKLVRLSKTLNTKTAKLISIRRTTIVNDFINSYLEEVNLVSDDNE